MFFPLLRRGTRQRSKDSQHHGFIYDKLQTGRAAGNRKQKARIKSLPQNGSYPPSNRHADHRVKTNRRISEIQMILFSSLKSYFDGLKMSHYVTL